MFLSLSRSTFRDFVSHPRVTWIPITPIHSNSQRFSHLYGCRDKSTPHGCQLQREGAAGNPSRYPTTDVRSSSRFTESHSDGVALGSDQYLGEFKGNNRPGVWLRKSLRCLY